MCLIGKLAGDWEDEEGESFLEVGWDRGSVMCGGWLQKKWVCYITPDPSYIDTLASCSLFGVCV